MTSACLRDSQTWWKPRIPCKQTQKQVVSKRIPAIYVVRCPKSSHSAAKSLPNVENSMKCTCSSLSANVHPKDFDRHKNCAILICTVFMKRPKDNVKTKICCQEWFLIGAPGKLWNTMQIFFANFFNRKKARNWHLHVRMPVINWIFSLTKDTPLHHLKSMPKLFL